MQAEIQLSADFLFRGAFYAAEQAGSLLQRAVDDYKMHGDASATILAVYSREEIGRARLLLEYRARAERGEIVRSDKTFRALIRNHLAKLEAGQFFVPVQLPQRELREILQEEVSRPTYHPEDAPFYEELYRRVDKARKDRASIFHEQRLKAIHVDLSDDGTTWNRPGKTHASWVNLLLHDLAREYMELHSDLSAERDQGIFEILKQWPDRPALPQPMYVPWDESGEEREAWPIARSVQPAPANSAP
jgi:AbiV family abortive infection protein